MGMIDQRETQGDRMASTTSVIYYIFSIGIHTFINMTQASWSSGMIPAL
jgi:hypothetical protein